MSTEYLIGCESFCWLTYELYFPKEGSHSHCIHMLKLQQEMVGDRGRLEGQVDQTLPWSRVAASPGLTGATA